MIDDATLFLYIIFPTGVILWMIVGCAVVFALVGILDRLGWGP